MNTTYFIEIDDPFWGYREILIPRTTTVPITRPDIKLTGRLQIHNGEELFIEVQHDVFEKVEQDVPWYQILTKDLYKIERSQTTRWYHESRFSWVAEINCTEK